MFLTANKPLKQKAGSFESTIAALDGGGYKSTSGVYVNEDTALRQATVYACVRALAETIAHFPIEVQTRRKGQWVNSEDHEILELLSEPNDWQTQHDLISTMVSWSEMDGNAYHYKIKDGSGRVRQLLPIKSNDVGVDLAKDRSVKYTVASSDLGIEGTFDKNRVFHLRNFGTQGYMGISTISNHRDPFGLALQLENHASNSFANGLQTNKWVKLENPLNGEELEVFKREIAKYQGGDNAGKMPVMNAAEFKEFSGISAVDAQYIETRKMQKEEIATIFLVPLFVLNSTENTTWGSGLEQIFKAFVRISLNPRMNRISQTLVRELVPEKSRHKTRIKFDTQQFTLGEFKDRMDGYRAAIESGVYNPDECREVEGKNPREGGDKYRQPVNIAIEGETNEVQDPEPTS